MYNFTKRTSSELWAIVDKTGSVMWSRGGSSSSPRLLIYESEKKANTAMKSPWIKQIIEDGEAIVSKIYSANK